MTAPLAEQVAAAIRDARFTWVGGPDGNFDDHIADAVLRVVAEWLGSERAHEDVAASLDREGWRITPHDMADVALRPLLAALTATGDATRHPDAPNTPAPVSQDPRGLRGAQGGAEGRDEGGAL